MRPHPLALVATMTSVLSASAASAQGLPGIAQSADLEAPAVTEPPQVSKPAPQPVLGGWYGWQIVLSDLASVALVVSADRAFDSAAPGYAGVGTWLVAPSVIHGANGARAGTVVGSLALRAMLPMVGAFLGSGLESCAPDEWFCGLEGAVVGGLVGITTASLIDATFLAWAPPAKDRGLQASLSAMPVKNGGGLVLGGVF